MRVVRAAVCPGAGAGLQVTEIMLPEPGPGQVRVRLAAVGLCRTDRSLAGGALPQAFPAVLGHECTGVVAALGTNVDGLALGDSVLLNWAPACGVCSFCRAGEPHLCARARARDRAPHATLGDGTTVYAGLGVGGFAEETVIPAGAVTRLPADLPLAESALLGCAVLTGFGAVFRAARVRPGESVVVVGVGGVGLSVLAAARLAGAAPIIAVDVRPDREAPARAVGATEFVTVGPGALTAVGRHCGGTGADQVFECAGGTDSARLAWAATRRGGAATMLGLADRADELRIPLQSLVYSGRTLRGCLYGACDPGLDLPVLAEHARAGRLHLGEMVGDRIDLEGLPDAFAAELSGPGRTLVVFPGVTAPPSGSPAVGGGIRG